MTQHFHRIAPFVFVPGGVAVQTHKSHVNVIYCSKFKFTVLSFLFFLGVLALLGLNAQYFIHLSQQRGLLLEMCHKSIKR